MVQKSVYRAVIENGKFKIQRKTGIIFCYFKDIFETDNHYRWIQKIATLKNQGDYFITH